MADILNMALKKDVFESLMSGTGNEIPIEKTKWWTKRLKDEDTGRFKDFKVVRASSGSADKYDFPIAAIEDRGSEFVVVVELKNDASDSSEIETTQNPVVVPVETEPIIVNDVPKTMEEIQKEINERFLAETMKEQAEPIQVNQIERKEVEKKPEPKVEKPSEDYKTRAMNLLEDFSKKQRVIVVTGVPDVTILTNGRVLGTSKNLFSGRTEKLMKFPFETVEFVKFKWMSDDDFIWMINKKMEELRSGNYVFLKKSKCGFTKVASGEDVFVMKVVTKKVYLFMRKKNTGW